MITINDLTPAQKDALTNVRVPLPQSADFGKAFLRKAVHTATRAALMNKGLLLADGALSPDGLMLHQSLAAEAGMPNAFDQMAEYRRNLDKRAAVERERDVRVKQVAENFRGIMVQPFGVANVERRDVDLADEITRYLKRGHSTTIPFTLEHLEAVAALVRRGKLVNQVIEVD